MTPIERHRHFYEYEQDCTQKMLAMIASVPEANRSQPGFQQAINIAAHLAACRENWLDFMAGEGKNQTAWFEESSPLDSLSARFAAIEGRWRDYFTHLTEAECAGTFEFSVPSGERFRIPTEVQINQLIFHALYHRGQIALLVDQLGGEVVDTDYVEWVYARL